LSEIIPAKILPSYAMQRPLKMRIERGDPRDRESHEFDAIEWNLECPSRTSTRYKTQKKEAHSSTHRFAYVARFHDRFSRHVTVTVKEKAFARLGFSIG